MKWFFTVAAAVGGCLAAAPLKLSISPMVPYSSYEPVFVFALRVRNVGTEAVNVTMSFNQTFPAIDVGRDNVERDNTEVVPLSMPLEKPQLRADAAEAINHLYEPLPEDGEGKQLVLKYHALLIEDVKTPITKIQECLASHADDCEFPEWEEESQCRPVVRLVTPLHYIGLDYTDVFENCQPHDLQADVEFVANHLKVTKVRAHTEKHRSSWPLLDKWLSRVPEVQRPAPQWSTSNDPLRSQQWYWNFGHMDVLPAYGMLSPTEYKPRVALISTGADMANIDLMIWNGDDQPLTGNNFINQVEVEGKPKVDDDGNGFVDDKYGWTAGEKGLVPAGANGVGTEIAGIIGALYNNGIGIAGLAGYNVEILHCQRFTRYGNYTNDALDRECFEYAEANGADIVLYDHAISTNSPQPLSADMKAVFDRWAELERPIIMPTGNTGRGITCSGSAYLYPACWNYPNHFTVSSLDKNDRVSNNGETGTKAVKTFLPASDMLTTGHRMEIHMEDFTTKSNHRFAAAFMTAVAANIKNYNPHFNSYMLNDIMRSSARGIYAWNTEWGALLDFETTGHLLEHENVAVALQGANWAEHHKTARPLKPGQHAQYLFLAAAVPGETREVDGEFVVYTVNTQDNGRLLDRAKAKFNLNYAQESSFKQTEGEITCAEEEAFEIDLNELLLSEE